MKNMRYMFLIGLLITSQSIYSQQIAQRGRAEGGDSLLLFIPDDTLAREAYREEFLGLCEGFISKRKNYKDEVSYLRFVFSQIVEEYLNHYEQYVSTENVFKEKRYNCVSGTAFFALVLEQIGYSYTIRETYSHTYLLAFTQSDEVVLIESTDRQHGFISDYVAIQAKIETYRNNEQRLNNQIGFFQRNISLKELAGLQWYNEAVVLFNEKNFKKAEEMLAKALEFYNCKRIRDLKSYSGYYASYYGN